MTRMEKLENMETKIEKLINDLDILCPEISFYQRQKKSYEIEKKRLDKVRETGNVNNLTILVDRYEYILAALKMIRSKF